MKRKPSKKRVQHIVNMTAEYLREATKHYVGEVATPERVASIEKTYTECLEKYFDRVTCKYDLKTGQIHVSVTLENKI